jgi:hypothetical protein
MPLVLDATVGGVASNSFGTLAEADAYHATQLHLTQPWPANIAAAATLGSGANGLVTVRVPAGTSGNGYTLQALLAATPSQPLSATLVGTAITVTLATTSGGVSDGAKNTATLVAAMLNTLPGITASASGTGVTVVQPTTSVIAFTGGSSREDIKIPSLIMAQQWMTTLIVWTGFYATNTQRLPWPRNSMWARNDQVYVQPDAIPDEVKWAQFEQARLFQVADRTLENDIAAQGLSSLSAGPVSLSWSGGGSTALQPPVIPRWVLQLLVPSWIDYVEGLATGMRELMRA